MSKESKEKKRGIEEDADALACAKGQGRLIWFRYFSADLTISRITHASFCLLAVSILNPGHFNFLLLKGVTLKAMEMLLVRAAVPFPVARSSQNQAQVPEPTNPRHPPCPSQPKYSKANRSSDFHKSSKTSSLSIDNSGQNQSLSLDSENISVPPLPLTGSRSVFPSPLKFLWFNRNEHETKETDVSGDASCEIPSLSSNQETQTLTLNRGEESTSSEVFSILDSSDLSNLELNIDQIQDSNDDISKAILGTTEGEELSKIDAECAKGWLQNFINIRSFWKKQDTTPITMASGNDYSKQIGVGIIDEAENNVLNGGEMDSGEEMMACCEGCLTESLMELKVEAGKEMPHVRIHHTQDSFAKFLHRVPVSELKTVSHMSFLSNLAYVIPSIKVTHVPTYKF